jgi:hypothetical protein
MEDFQLGLIQNGHSVDHDVEVQSDSEEVKAEE